MKKKSVMLIAIICFSTLSYKSQSKQNDSSMEKEIKDVVIAFVKAGEERNVSAYDQLLHEDFRVIANRYPTPDKTSIIPAASYIALITKKVIGGNKLSVVFKDIDIADHSATVLAHFKDENGGGQLVTILLVKNQEAKWQIIADMATQIKK